MDLWIRSQDRTKLVKADNISYMDTAEDYKKEVHSLWNDCKGILGTYKTKERALEVLDDIQNNMLKGSFAKKINGLGQEVDLIPNPIFIYIMPRE